MVNDDEAEVPVPQPKRRHFITALALHANRHLTTEALTDLVWGEESSAKPGTIRTYTWALRNELNFRDRIDRDSRGYKFTLDSHEIDVSDFRALLATGTEELESGNFQDAANSLGKALLQCQDDPLPDLPETEKMAPIKSQLLDEIETAHDRLIAAQLMLGQHRGVLRTLTQRSQASPTQEAIWSCLMLAQYRCGMRADALSTFATAQKALAEYGLDPGPALKRLHTQILADDQSLWDARALLRLSA